VHKPGSAELASALGGVAGELLRLGAAARAEPYLRECVALRETLFPDEHPRSWTKQTARSQLGESLCGQGRFAEAEPLLIAACEALRGDARVPLPAKTKGKDLKREALERVIRLYEAWDQAEPGKGFDARAAEWRQKP
jgi:hypothetical protein